MNSFYLEIDELIAKLSSSNILSNETLIDSSNSDNALKKSTAESIMKCVEIKYEPSKGRYCVANRDISAGECLFVEKAYCAILIPDFASSYCQNCFKAIYEPISIENEFFFNYLNIEFCSKCNTVVYCSKECRQASLFHHSFECEILPELLHNLGIAHLAYRVVASTPSELMASVCRSDTVKDIMKDIDYKNENNFKKTDYEQVYHLVTHESETHVYDLFKYAMTAILLGSFYAEKLKTETSSGNNESDLITFSSLILRQIVSRAFNLSQIN